MWFTVLVLYRDVDDLKGKIGSERKQNALSFRIIGRARPSEQSKRSKSAYTKKTNPRAIPYE